MNNIMNNMKKGFTLVEMMIVIGIIGALAAVLISQAGGITEQARATKCKSHMRNLAQGVQAFAVAHEHYPCAGSHEVEAGLTLRRRNKEYYGVNGWIGWGEGSVDKYVAPFNQSHNQKGWNESYSNNLDNPDKGAQFAVTNGVIWSHIKDLESYVCPVHRNMCKKNGFTPLWSYVMNAAFGYDSSRGSGSSGDGSGGHDYDHYGIEFGGTPRPPDRMLLFAEMQFADIGFGDRMIDKRSPGDWAADCTLQYRTDKNARFNDKGNGGRGTLKCLLGTALNNKGWREWNGDPESIGFNHKAGKRHVAHVVFADCHVGTLVLPIGATQEQLEKLTANLCNGIQLTFTGGRYLDIEGNE